MGVVLQLPRPFSESAGPSLFFLCADGAYAIIEATKSYQEA